MNAIELERVSYRYPGAERAALCELSLTVAPGEFVVLAGGSGSGKSTLLRAIGGLVPHFHGGEFAGVARAAGRSTRDHGPGELAAVVGSLFQDPETQVVMGTARAELAFPLENRGLSPAAIARAVEETALALAIEPLLDRPTAELSGGELQRVALGATLAVGPPIVCLDEPTSQLDPVAGDELIGLLRRLNDDRELTVLLAEHRLERCLPYADRVIAMVEGRVGFDGAPQDFLEWALAAAPGLATPGATLLSKLGLPPAAGVKRARQALREASHPVSVLGDAGGDDDGAGGRHAEAGAAAAARRRPRWPRTRPLGAEGSPGPALRISGAWHELRDGPAILRGVSLTVAAGERVALMGRNGAGKSTLLKHVAGLMRPTRGTVELAGRAALVMQNPGDYLVHETVAEETGLAALRRFDLDRLQDRHPRELSGGERQRLALAIVIGAAKPEPGDTAPTALVCLDEPTRGMDRTVKDQLAELLITLDAAVVVATHDPEFAAAFAERVVLMADGTVIADAPVGEVLSGGAYFATETARILGGAGQALLPVDGAALLRGASRAGSQSGPEPQRMHRPDPGGSINVELLR